MYYDNFLARILPGFRGRIARAQHVDDMVFNDCPIGIRRDDVEFSVVFALPKHRPFVMCTHYRV